MAQRRLLVPVPRELVPSPSETHFCTELMLTPQAKIEEFCTEFIAMVRGGAGRIVNGTIIVHTEQLGIRHISMDNISRVQSMYREIFPALKDSVHSSIIVVENEFMHAAINVVLRSVREPATKVSVVKTTREALQKAHEIANDVHVPALRARVASMQGPAKELDARMENLLSVALCAVCLWSHGVRCGRR